MEWTARPHRTPSGSTALLRTAAFRAHARTQTNCFLPVGLSFYQPKLICRKTHGVVAHDHFWLKYADDPPELCYADLLREMSKAIRITPDDEPTPNE